VQAAGGTPLSAPTRPRRVGLLLAVAAFVLAADVISKSIVVARMADHQPIRLLGGLLTITLTRNGGAAFSIGTSMTIVFTAIAVGVIVYILRTARNLRSIGWAITLGLLLGGATGNLLDRIFRAPGPFQGHVVDWIELPHWPVFNLADSSIVCAGVLVVLLALFGIRLDGTRPIPAASAPQPYTAEPEPDTSKPDTSEPYTPEPANPASATAASATAASATAASVTPTLDSSASDSSASDSSASDTPERDTPVSDTPESDNSEPEYRDPDRLVSDRPAEDGR
jgi:lipoprotein signal peptidase